MQIPKFEIEYLPSKAEGIREIKPEYPNGVDVDLSAGAQDICVATLIYPAPQSGLCNVTCQNCGYQIALSVHAMADDAKSIKVPCFRAAFSENQPEMDQLKGDKNVA